MIGESRGARIRWLADRYSVEKLTSFLALAGDAHGLDDDVDLVVLQRGDAVGRRQDAVLDLRRRAEDVARHLAGDVDVEAGDLTGDRVAEAEQVAADVEADDEPAAVADVGDGVVGLGLGGERPQARRCSRARRRRSAGCTASGATSSMPAGVGGASVTLGTGDRRARTGCSRPAPRTAASADASVSVIAHSSVLAQPRPQPERHRDRRDHAEHRRADGRARQHPPRVDDVVAQLLTALRDALGQRGVELVERGRGVVLAGAERDLGGGLVVADGDVGVDPVVGGAPAPQQLFGVGQVGLVDRVVAAEVVRRAAAASCRCAGSRTACGRPRRRAGSATASRRPAPAGR